MARTGTGTSRGQVDRRPEPHRGPQPHRVLFSLEGHEPGQTRRALAAIPYDEVHVFTTDPDTDEVRDLGSLVERSGGTFTAEPVPDADLLAAFRAISAAMAARDDDDTARACSVNAGPDANLLSAAGLMACLHEGVEAHFLHEKGHTVVPVLTQAPLREMLNAREKQALIRFPVDGVPIDQLKETDTRALNVLKKRGLVALAHVEDDADDGDGTPGDRLVLTDPGRAFRDHLRA